MKITHPDKILFPKSKITKKDLAEYYAKVSKLMLPLIKNRPISMKRFPQGINKTGFFQKNAPEQTPSFIKTTPVSRKEKNAIHMILCNDKKTLLWLANQNCITPHIWLSKIDKPNNPDRLVFDLDPPSRKGFNEVVKGALLLKEALEKTYKLTPFVTTTGSKGLHVVVPIKPAHTFEQVRAFAKKVASHLVETNPHTFTTQVRKNKRQGKIYIDILRNGNGQTVVAPYAVRAHEGAPVATPLTWAELKKPSLRSDTYNIKNFHTRLKKNPWTGIERKAKMLKI